MKTNVAALVKELSTSGKIELLRQIKEQKQLRTFLGVPIHEEMYKKIVAELEKYVKV